MSDNEVNEKIVSDFFRDLVEKKHLNHCQHDILEKLICSLKISSCDLQKSIRTLNNKLLSTVSYQYLRTANMEFQGDIVFNGAVIFTSTVNPWSGDLQTIEEKLQNVIRVNNGVLQIDGSQTFTEMTIDVDGNGGGGYEFYALYDINNVLSNYGLALSGTPYSSGNEGTVIKFTFITHSVLFAGSYVIPFCSSLTINDVSMIQNNITLNTISFPYSSTSYVRQDYSFSYVGNVWTNSCVIYYVY